MSSRPGRPLYEGDLVYASRIFERPRHRSGYEVDEWEGTPHGGADEIAATVDRIRAQLPY